jgi:signal transduction histidine kinase
MGLPPLGRAGVGANPAQVGHVAHAASAALRVGFVLLGPDGRVDDATPTACECLGVTDPDNLRAHWHAIHPLIAASISETGDTPPVADVTVEIAGRRHGVRCEVHPIGGDAGSLLLVQPSRQAAAVEGVLRLASRYQTLASHSSTTSHDFNGAFNSILLNVELLSRTLEPGAARADDAEVRAHCVQAIRRELGRLAQSVARVVDEVAVDDEEPSRCRLAAVFESVVAAMGARAGRQRVTIRVDAPDDTVEVMARAAEIRLAVMNLAANALDAMPQGGALTLSLRRDGDAALLTVSDTGPGISREIRRRIWDRYFSTKSPGHGIGLDVARSVAHAHGGTVTLDRTASGAQFTIRLPIAR